ncbi:MAG: DUF6655 family protein [Candidatus Brocadiia bacterium]
MKPMLRLVTSALLLGCLAVAGCGSFRETFPPRSASEQLLISEAVDTAVADMPTDWMEDRVVYVETANLDAYDEPYVVQGLRNVVLESGGRLSQGRDGADVVLEVASGALSVDKGQWLLGIPELPLPIPFADETLKLPELPLFKLVSYAGKAKLISTAVEADSGASHMELPVCYGRVHHRLWWAFVMGPFTWSDLPKGVR